MLTFPLAFLNMTNAEKLIPLVLMSLPYVSYQNLIVQELQITVFASDWSNLNKPKFIVSIACGYLMLTNAWAALI